MKSREVIRLLEQDGWVRSRQTGSHVQFKHKDRRGTVTVAHPKNEIPIGTLKEIERKSGLKLR